MRSQFRSTRSCCACLPSRNHLLPSCLLGMISPVAVKSALRDLAQTGHVVGRIYAVSTVASILGTFATGFFLIARFGTRAILFGVAGVLVICATIALIGAR